MKIILFSRLCHRSGSVALSLPRLSICISLVSLVLLSAAGWAGYWLGASRATPVVESEAGKAIELALQKQRRELDETRRQTQQHLDSMARRIGRLQSELLRLDALGEQLIQVGGLDAEEFDFNDAPAVGGLASDEESSSVELSELLGDMDRLSRRIADRQHKLDLIEQLLVGKRVADDLIPAGRPVDKGWLSSRYGYRKDPFTGKKTFHHGVDIAGKAGAEVHAVAAGVVTEAGPKKGYGYLVEITHADGLVTRYAHNSKIFVKVGDLVDKGDRIGAMGSTGRSTGPHVHFEISRNGKSLNPVKYLRGKG